MKIIKFILFSLLFLLISLISYVYIGSSGLIGDLPKDGNIVPKVEIKTEQNQKGIFFGDLHVHTTFSQDAFLFSLPMLQGEGVHPPSDACNFARYCSSLDFFSITDHAEAITKDMWDSTINSLRSCEISDKNGNKDLLAFPGWEWTQMGQSPDNHYGHKNVILRDLDKVPERPIGAGTTGIDSMIDNPIMPLLPLVLDFPPERIDFDFLAYAKEVYGSPICSEEITEDCRESALTPKELFKKLNNLKVESLVIPHGTTWGIHSPPESSFKTQLENGNHDPLKQRLIEVYSGHGNSELYKDIKHVDYDEKGNPFCPAPTEFFEPCCWRAGEIALEKCSIDDEEICIKEAKEAKNNFVKNISNILTKFSVVEGATPEDWKQCGQLKNTFLPSYTYRPKMSAQYALAAKNIDEGKEVSFKFGLIGSTDNHKARAGSGYKEFAKKAMGDSWGANDRLTWLIAPERGASFYSTGGLVAVHAKSLERKELFNSLYNRQTYATSGERILLWFDLVNSEEGIFPMGSETLIRESPEFRVKAIGSFKQKEGCPDYVHSSLSQEEISRLCLGECYNPSDERNKIERIEVVKIIPSQEEVRIFDPWKVIPCIDEGEGCLVNFKDNEMVEDTAYYVRAIQEESLAVGGDPLRCEKNEEGECIRINICYASGNKFDPKDDCLAPINERAWSSPIFLSREKDS